jgi:hypothetical protein
MFSVFTRVERCLGAAGNGQVAFPVSVDSAPSGRGFFKALGVYRPMTLMPCEARGSHGPEGHLKPGHLFFCLSPGSLANNLALGSLKSDDRQLA